MINQWIMKVVFSNELNESIVSDLLWRHVHSINGNETYITGWSFRCRWIGQSVGQYFGDPCRESEIDRSLVSFFVVDLRTSTRTNETTDQLNLSSRFLILDGLLFNLNNTPVIFDERSERIRRTTMCTTELFAIQRSGQWSNPSGLMGTNEWWRGDGQSGTEENGGQRGCVADVKDTGRERETSGEGTIEMVEHREEEEDKFYRSSKANLPHSHTDQIEDVRINICLLIPQFTLSTLFSWNQVTVVIETIHVERRMSSWTDRKRDMTGFSLCLSLSVANVPVVPHHHRRRRWFLFHHRPSDQWSPLFPSDQWTRSSDSMAKVSRGTRERDELGWFPFSSFYHQWSKCSSMSRCFRSIDRKGNEPHDDQRRVTARSPHIGRERNGETEQLTSLASPSLLIKIVSHSRGPWPCASARSSLVKIFFSSIRSKRSEERKWACSVEVPTSFSWGGEKVSEQWRISFGSCRYGSIGLRKRPTKSNSIEKKKSSFGRCLAWWRRWWSRVHSCQWNALFSLLPNGRKTNWMTKRNRWRPRLRPSSSPSNPQHNPERFGVFPILSQWNEYN